MTRATAALFAGVLFYANTVQAGVPTLAGATRATTRHNQTAAHALTVAQLRSARTMLERANHDYDGHRAAAVKSVTAALHTLAPGQAHPPTAATAGKPKAAGKGKKAGKKAVTEPQAVSDQQLRQAHQLITLAAARLPADHTAVGHLQHASQELAVALKIR